jgi:uncharacterized membrane protein
LSHDGDGGGAMRDGTSGVAMLVVLMLIGAVIGALAGEAALFGAMLGAAAGWLLSRHLELARELQRLRDRLDLVDGGAPRPAVSATPAPGLVVPAEPAPAQPDPVPAAPGPIRAEAPAPAAVASGSMDEVRADWTASIAQSRASDDAPAFELPAARTPEWQQKLAGAMKRWFTEGNVPVKVGMLVLFFGVAALLKFAADQGMFDFPIELRLAGVGAAAAAGLLFGWRQRLRRPAFGLALQGGAIGVMLLTVFAAFRLYGVLPAGPAFVLLLVLVAGSALLALLQNALPLAVLGSVGGFLAPILVSTGSGNHVALFSYYAVLNAGIFALAWVRPWRVLNLVGFGFTFAIATLWGIDAYRPEHFATTEPFLILFFLFYVAIAVLYALRQPGGGRGLVDGSLVFGTPLLAFPLQAALLHEQPMALAWSALAVALLYAALAAVLMKRDGLRTLALSFAALALGFATLAVPLALDAGATAGTWALEGAALVWLGLRQQRRLTLFSGVALQVLAGLAYLIRLSDGAMAQTPFLNGPFLAGMLLAGAALFSAYRLEADGRWRALSLVGFVAGIAWWTLVGLNELRHFSDSEGALLGWLVVSLLLAAGLHQRLPWPRLAWPMQLALLCGLLLALFTAFDGGAPLRGIAALTWPLLLAAGALALAVMRAPLARGISIAHVLWLSTIACIAGLELQHHVAEVTGRATSWRAVAVMLPLALLLWASWRRPDVAAQPLAAHFARYRLRWFAPASTALLLWWTLSLWHPGDAAPLPYLPLFNPLELAQLGVLLLLAGVWREHADAASRQALPAIIAGLVFVWISVATLRGVHQLAAIGWDTRLPRTMLAQTSLTVAWSVVGVGAWIAGSKWRSRAVWLAGAVLMGIVLAKLILIDRTHMGNIPGIVSFLAVGVLLTVVGYFAPSPPPRAAPTAEAAT